MSRVILLGGLAGSLSAMRSLGERDVPVTVLSGDNAAGEILRFSRFCQSFFKAHADNIQEAWLKWLTAEQNTNAIIIPCSDSGLELVSRQRDTLEGRGFSVPLANDQAVLTLLDKEKTNALARASGIPTPRTAMVTHPDQIEDAFADVGLPCAAKPVVKHQMIGHTGWKGLRIDRGSAGAMSSLKDALDIGPIQITEIVPGSEDQYGSYYTYIDDSGVAVFETTKQKWRQWPVGFGDGSYHITKTDSEIRRLGRQFCQGAEIRGLAVVEFKRDVRTQEFKLIECNARITDAHELMRVAGLDIAGFIYARATGQPDPDLTSYVEGLTLWRPAKDVLAFGVLWRRRELSASRWIRQVVRSHVYQIFSWTDPGPAMAMPFFRLRQVGQRLAS